MKVRDLIAKLAGMDPDIEVLLYERYYDDDHETAWCSKLTDVVSAEAMRHEIEWISWDISHHEPTGRADCVPVAILGAEPIPQMELTSPIDSTCQVRVPIRSGGVEIDGDIAPTRQIARS